MTETDVFMRGEDWVVQEPVIDQAPTPQTETAREFHMARGNDRMSPYVRNIDVARAQYQAVSNASASQESQPIISEAERILGVHRDASSRDR